MHSKPAWLAGKKRGKAPETEVAGDVCLLWSSIYYSSQLIWQGLTAWIYFAPLYEAVGTLIMAAYSLCHCSYSESHLSSQVGKIQVAKSGLMYSYNKRIVLSSRRAYWLALSCCLFQTPSRIAQHTTMDYHQFCCSIVFLNALNAIACTPCGGLLVFL